MSLDAERILLSATLKKAGITLAISMPNQPFDIPKKAAYGEFHIVSGDGQQIGIEGEELVRNRYAGFVQLTIRVPEGSGTKPATDAADLLAKAFCSKVGRDKVGAIYRFKVLRTFAPMIQNGQSIHVYRVPYTRDIVERRQAGGYTL